MRARIFTFILLVSALLVGCSNGNTEQPNTIDNPDRITKASGVVIPDVSNVSAASAEQVIVNAGLIPVLEEIDHDSVSKGNVINCSPEIGSSAEPNSRVIVYVSRGNIYGDILSALEKGNYEEARTLLSAAHEYDWFESMEEQVAYEADIYSIITDIKYASETPDDFKLHDINLYQFNSFKDINGDTMASEDVVNHPFCLIKYSLSESEVLSAGFYYDTNRQSYYQFYPHPYNENDDLWGECKRQYSSYTVDNYNISHFMAIFNNDTEYSEETSANKSYKICSADGCTREASYEYELFGLVDYYCYTHYTEIIDMIGIMEEDVGAGIYSKHTCEECSKEGTHSIIGFSGISEWYCTEHYEEMKQILEILLSK